MQILRRDEDVVFMTAIENWMAGQSYTEVFNFSLAEPSHSEMEITDRLLDEVLNRVPNIDQALTDLRKADVELVKGKKAEPGQQSLGSALGRTYDAIFKNLVKSECKNGRLKPYEGRLVVVEQGERGPDIWMQPTA